MSDYLRIVSDFQRHVITFERCYNIFSLPSELGYTEQIQLSPLKDESPKNNSKNEAILEALSSSVSYLDGKLALQNISFKISPGEKIGVLGHTGAGKSTLFSSIYRGVELTKGQMKFNGRPITEFGVNELRSMITVIPQDPYFFNGTLVSNIDPHETWKKERIADLLKEMEIWENFQEKGGLEFNIENEGVNLSSGEKQLLQLARAIIKCSKLVLMDEPTSSVDPKTDDLVQKIINKSFSDCTLLIIAHRLQTIKLCDKVLVLQNGSLAEFDKPSVLVNQNGSLFKRIVDSLDQQW